MNKYKDKNLYWNRDEREYNYDGGTFLAGLPVSTAIRIIYVDQEKTNWSEKTFQIYQSIIDNYISNFSGYKNLDLLVQLKSGTLLLYRLKINENLLVFNKIGEYYIFKFNEELNMKHEFSILYDYTYSTEDERKRIEPILERDFADLYVKAELEAQEAEMKQKNDEWVKEALYK
jgi:hypothetical protein